MRAILLAGFLVAASAPALAADDGCKAVDAAQHALFHVNYHKHVTSAGLGGGTMEADDTVFGNKEYILVGAIPGLMPAEKNVKPHNGAKDEADYNKYFGKLAVACKIVGHETVNGEEADIYAMFGPGGQVPPAGPQRLWIGRTSGHLLKSELPTVSGTPNREAYNYDVAKAPW